MWHDVVIVITERKRVKDELRLLSEITANAAEGITLFKASDGTIHYANKRFEMLFGYAPGELMGKPTYILNAPTDKSPQEASAEIMWFLEEQGVWSGDVCSQKKGGTAFWTHAIISSFRHSELGTLLICYQSDITERKNMMDSLNLSSLVQLNSSEGMLVTDENNLIIAINFAFTTITGTRLTM